MTKLITRSLVAAAILLPLTGCPGGIPGGATTPTAGITGNIVKGTAPFPDATVVLQEKINNAFTDKTYKKTDSLGNYTFDNVPPGEYRVIFDRATEAQRKNKDVVYHAGNVDSFGFFAGQPFTFSGTSTATHQEPQLNVQWSTGMSPAPDASVTAPVNFTWNNNIPGATKFSVRIADDKNNTIFNSGDLPASANSYSWDGKSSSGTQRGPGSYLWSVNFTTDKGTGGSNVSKFTLQ